MGGSAGSAGDDNGVRGLVLGFGLHDHPPPLLPPPIPPTPISTHYCCPLGVTFTFFYVTLNASFFVLCLLCQGQVDRLLLELKLPPADAYFKLVHTLEEVRRVQEIF